MSIVSISMKAWLPAAWRIVELIGTRLSPGRRALLDRLKELTEKNNELTGKNNELTGKNNELTGKNNELTGKNNELTGKNDELTGKNKELFGERQYLLQRIDALLVQVRAADRGTPAHSSIDPEVETRATPKQAAAGIHWSTPTNRRSKFLIVSNMRSGSTWLETLLGALPDVFTDFEFKFATSYQPTVGHYVLDELSPRVTDALQDMPSAAPVVGSKFVFDVQLTRPDIALLREKLGLDVQIIHLTRCYRDVFLSRRRGFYHQLNAAKAGAIGEQIKAAIIQAQPPADPAVTGRQSVAKVDCFEELCNYIQHDASVIQLRGERPYLRVAYEEIKGRLIEIARFIGSTATADEVAELLTEPPTLKLPDVAADALVPNIAELEPLFKMAEAMRSHLLTS
jgi:hypothetical protein